jgi:hypothetical protein
MEDDEIGIEGLRFVLDDTQELQPEYLYFCDAASYFTSEQYKSAFLAVNRHSTMLFMRSDYSVLLNAMLSAFEFFTHLEGRLLDAASSNAPLRTFMEIMEPVLENPFLVANLDGSFCLATETTGHKVDPLWENTSKDSLASHPAIYAPYYDSDGKRIQELSERPQIVRNVYEGGAPVIMMYMRQNNESVGGIAILQENSALTEQNMQLAPIFARYCIRAEEFVSASGAIRSRSAVFQNLLDGKDVGPLNIHRLEKLLKQGPWRLLQFHLVDRTDQIAKNALLLNLRAQSELYLPLSLDDSCYAVIRECVLQDRLQGRYKPLQLHGVTIGASMPFSDLSSISIRKQQSEFALEQSDNHTGLFLCESFACSYLLRSFRSKELTPSLLHPALEALEKYDEENQSELRKTLSVYLRNERNQLFSARSMHIHPNTMRYRLQRIMEIAGLTLEDAEELKYLRLSDWLE